MKASKAIGFAGVSIFLLIAFGAAAGADEAIDLAVDQRIFDERINQVVNAGQNPGAGSIFSADENLVTGSPAVGGSFPRSILIPGTETSLKISGWISEHIDYWFAGGPPNAGPATSNTGASGQVQAIPLRNTTAAARSNGVFSESPNPSRFIVETRTPTAFGEARTVMAWDWAGSTPTVPGGPAPSSVSNDLVPRLLYAYGTLGGLLAGQANSNFRDPDGEAETVEFGGNVGSAGVTRIPQLRWTMETLGGALSVSAETPETDIGTAAGVIGSDAGSTATVTTSCNAAAPGSAATPSGSTCASTLLTSGSLPVNIAKSTAPDFTAAFYSPQPWGHFSISAMLRAGLDFNDGQFINRDFIGYGGHGGFDLKPGWFGWAKDDFTLDFTSGMAIGRYLNTSTNFALATNYGAPGKYGAFGGPTSASAASAVLINPTTEFGGEIGYQHWWFDELRSNISYGINHHDIPANIVGATQAGSMNKELMTAHANFIWNPFASFEVGLEYMWGQRRVVNNQSGNENVLITRFRFLY
jgi:hypothetical protein